MAKVNFKIYDVTDWKHKIHILHNRLSKGNQAMKFDHLNKIYFQK